MTTAYPDALGFADLGIDPITPISETTTDTATSAEVTTQFNTAKGGLRLSE